MMRELLSAVYIMMIAAAPVMAPRGGSLDQNPERLLARRAFREILGRVTIHRLGFS